MSTLISSNPCGGCKDRPINDGACFSIATMNLESIGADVRVWVKPGLYVEVEIREGGSLLEFSEPEEIDAFIAVLRAARDAAYSGRRSGEW